MNHYCWSMRFSFPLVKSSSFQCRLTNNYNRIIAAVLMSGNWQTETKHYLDSIMWETINCKSPFLSQAFQQIPRWRLCLKSLQPNSRDCFACGVANPIGLKIRFYNLDTGEVEAHYTVPEMFQGYPGIVHGGIVAAMLDEIAYRSLIVDDPERLMFTARLNIRYRCNVPVEEPLRLVGKRSKVKQRSATAFGYIYSSAGELLAEAEALLIRVPDQMYGTDQLAELGWKVYSETDYSTTGSQD